MSSTHKDVMDAIATVIEGLSLTDMEEVAVRSTPADGGRIIPGITVSPVPEREFIGTNAYEHIGFGSLITMAINDNNDTDEHDVLAQWRQALRRTFNHQRLDGISLSCVCLTEPGDVYSKNLKADRRDMDVDFLVIRAIVTETRL